MHVTNIDLYILLAVTVSAPPNALEERNWGYKAITFPLPYGKIEQSH
jgi:hypothetical protein